jgi:hypothetical protein
LPKEAADTVAAVDMPVAFPAAGREAFRVVERHGDIQVVQ